MKNNEYPRGWDEGKVRRVLDHYENQAEEDAVAEDEAAFARRETVMQVPFELVPAVHELIAKHQTESQK